MTICIAASCQSTSYKEKTGPALVFVFDKSISLGGMTSIETGVKGGQLSNLWHALFAGEDVSHARTVIAAACEMIDENKHKSVKEIVRIMTTAYQQVRRKQIEDIYLSSLGWDLKEFTLKGKKLLSTSDFTRLTSEIQQYDLGCQFLVAGFDPLVKSSGLMFQVFHPGTWISKRYFSFFGYRFWCNSCLRLFG